jgi:hypothetical protein
MSATLYAILFHDGVADPHFDLMFQTGPDSPLSTWRLPVWRPIAPTTAEKLSDHRQAYLTFEGEISGGRGRVKRVEQGTCRAALSADGAWEVLLDPQPSGKKLVLHLRPISGEQWVCTTADINPG